MPTKDLTLEKTLLLRKAQDSREALGALFRLCKGANPKMSYAWLAKRAGIASRGFASDLVSGRRQIPLNARAGLARALGLDGTLKETFQALVARDHAKNEEARVKWDSRIRSLRRVLRVHRPKEILRPADRFFAFEVFCVFSLFGNAPTLTALEKYFGSSRRPSLDAALTQLESWGFIRRSGPRFRLVQSFVLFEAGDPAGPVDFLRASLTDALSRMETWFPARDEAIFQSSLLSVDRRRYVALLPKVRKALERLQTRFEAGKADVVIRFNVQIYPNAAGPNAPDRLNQAPDESVQNLKPN